MQNPIQGVIFDLDGVIVSTDEAHYLAWQRMSDDEGLTFDRALNEQLRGVSRNESLEIILNNSKASRSEAQKQALTQRKNAYYQEIISHLTPNDLLPNALNVLKELKKRNIKIAIGSSSKNAPMILEKVGLTGFFDAVVGGNDIKNSKPDPEVFVLTAHRLNLLPDVSVVVEDAEAGVMAALAAKMRVLAVGSAAQTKQPTTWRAASLLDINVADWLTQ